MTGLAKVPDYLPIAGFLISLLLLIYKGREFPVTKFLVIFFLLINAMSFFPAMTTFTNPDLHWGILCSLLVLSLSFTGPAFYLYMKKLLTDDHTSKSIDLWHFLFPTFLFLVILVAVIFPEVFVSDVDNFTSNPDFLTGLNTVFFYGFIPGMAFPAVGFTIMLGYSVGSAMHFVQFIKEKQVSMVLSKQRFMTRWLAVLWVMLVLQVAIVVLFLAKYMVLHDFSSLPVLIIFQWAISIGFLVMLISVFFRPAILCGLPRLPQSVDVIRNEKTAQELAYRQFIHQQIINRMENHKPYIQPRFGLAELSVLVNIPAHHLACYFRNELVQPFHTFRDAYRINYAKSLIKKGKLKGQSPKTFGFLSGFSSYRRFLTVFIRVEGCSVNEYLTRVKGEN